MSQDNYLLLPAIAPSEVKHIGLVGTGTIGSAWAAHFLAQGLEVTATDPSPKAEHALRVSVDKAWPWLTQLGLAEGASRERLHFKASMGDALAEVDFIQESTPEDEAIKDQVMVAISEVARPDIVIASSTSGITPSRLQAHCKNPQRMIVGHPFNPVYLIPLVEVVGGKRTAPGTLQWAMNFYQHWGKKPLHCCQEITGHLANRLQDVVLAETIKLVNEGIASSGDLDAALCDGPGLRWALMGAFMTGYLAAGDQGIAAVLGGEFDAESDRQAAPDPSLVKTIAQGVDTQMSGHKQEEAAQIRDEFLVGVLRLRAEIEEKYGFDQGRFFQSKVDTRLINDVTR